MKGEGKGRVGGKGRGEGERDRGETLHLLIGYASDLRNPHRISITVRRGNNS